MCAHSLIWAKGAVERVGAMSSLVSKASTKTTKKRNPSHSPVPASSSTSQNKKRNAGKAAQDKAPLSVDVSCVVCGEDFLAVVVQDSSESML